MFPEELKSMYQTLRSTEVLSYDRIDVFTQRILSINIKWFVPKRITSYLKYHWEEDDSQDKPFLYFGQSLVCEDTRANF